MPTYLVHGFRWPRAVIRTWIIIWDLEDAAAEWIVAPASAKALLTSFYTLFKFLPPSDPPSTPSVSHESNNDHKNLLRVTGVDHARSSPLNRYHSSKSQEKKFNDWSVVKLLEQCDLTDESGTCQPYAYVADYIQPINLSVDIAAEIAAYEQRYKIGDDTSGSRTPIPNPSRKPPTDLNAVNARSTIEDGKKDCPNSQPEWLGMLKDAIQAPEEEIKWYVVVCDDEERNDLGDEDDESETPEPIPEEGEEEEEELKKKPKGTGLRRLFKRGG